MSRFRIPIPPRLYQLRLLARPSWLIRLVVAAVLVLGSYALLSRLLRSGTTVVFELRELQRVWEWEIASGHHPGRNPIPGGLGLQDAVPNPARGTRRTYVAQTRPLTERTFPKRPVAGSIADLDRIMDLCDSTAGNFGRDCLEAMRVGAGLDVLDGRASESVDAWMYAYVEQPGDTPVPTHIDTNSTAIIKRKRGTPEPPLSLPQPVTTSPSAGPCSAEYPRIFHIFWAGPFTDKPYMALLSFLYTQNLGLDNSTETTVCRPQFWVWSYMGDKAAESSMQPALQLNPWSAPFLHTRFQDVIKFKWWNTVEQLDSIPELKNDWRKYKDELLNSGGHVVKPSKKTDSKAYDKPSVVLSDLARFVITYRYGGIYLDADTLLLRDWEELWGWRGAFAYRWSWHQDYNTAVLRMHPRSALGSFLFRTALHNRLDFHPMTITKYLGDAGLDKLLFRIPDPLFDPAFLTAEQLQLERPPFPEFRYFGHFFGTPSSMSAAPQIAGFEGFFRGAFSYHWHNFWWQAFDAERNWPDLGPRFYEGEGRQRALLLAQDKTLKQSQPVATTNSTSHEPKHDVDWSAVMKRTFEAYIRGERPNMYGEWLVWAPDT
ncbi:hypothetical protein EXIGLDRAFT_711121 [Exidia glandulosa HHB12029]|uniref:Glycosyltransferase family 32 protein n=1 Tax=Exidia glandulosa HHB12029 TaxID=1314781 RepID=A0A165NCN1_EXIGL|nr:hypothetical protein EXIGLDRAFT_711121 [Exidia glandulosa HHB12029]